VRADASTPDTASHIIKSETIHVSVAKIDRAYEMLGEVLISISLLKQSKALRNLNDKDVTEKINHLEMTTDLLQSSILNMRMLPIKSVYDKLKRQTRDLSVKSGKKVEFVTLGADVELDRIVIEEIYSSLLHIIRNSIDHGIELPAVRIERGKNEVGVIELITENRGDNVAIIIKDDGAGLNKKKILEKAKQKNLIDGKEEFTDSQIYNFIFHPGFSTAEQIIENSGRGVGMDVVKKTVLKLGGKIEIESKEGSGSKFEIILPLSASIIDGLITNCADVKLIFPILKIKHILTPGAGTVKTIKDGKCLFIIFENKTIPLIILSEFYKLKDSDYSNIEAGPTLIVEFENIFYGLAVDEIVNKQKIVAKSISKNLSNICGVKAGTILGDGSIGLIIEPSDIIEKFIGSLRQFSTGGQSPENSMLGKLPA